MSLPTLGFPGSMTSPAFARFERHRGAVGYHHGVSVGFTATVKAGAIRTVTLAGGTAVLPGLLVDSSTALDLTFAANTGSANRVDYLVIEGDWSANVSNAKVVTGSSATPPNLTQSEGALWQMPLYRVTVAPSATTVTLERCAPVPHVEQCKRTQTFTGQIVNPGGANEAIATLTFEDPGWPYRVRVVGAQAFETDSGALATGEVGYCSLIATVDGAELGRGRTDQMKPNTGLYMAQVDCSSAPRSGKATIQLLIGETGSIHANNLHTSAPNNFEVYLIPA